MRAIVYSRDGNPPRILIKLPTRFQLALPLWELVVRANYQSRRKRDVAVRGFALADLGADSYPSISDLIPT